MPVSTTFPCRCWAHRWQGDDRHVLWLTLSLKRPKLHTGLRIPNRRLTSSSSSTLEFFSFFFLPWKFIFWIYYCSVFYSFASFQQPSLIDERSWSVPLFFHFVESPFLREETNYRCGWSCHSRKFCLLSNTGMFLASLNCFTNQLSWKSFSTHTCLHQELWKLATVRTLHLCFVAFLQCKLCSNFSKSFILSSPSLPTIACHACMSWSRAWVCHFYTEQLGFYYFAYPQMKPVYIVCVVSGGVWVMVITPANCQATLLYVVSDTVHYFREIKLFMYLFTCFIFICFCIMCLNPD